MQFDTLVGSNKCKWNDAGPPNFWSCAKGLPVEYRRIRYTVRAGIERNEWTVSIHPAGIEGARRVVTGPRERAELLARYMIDRWYKCAPRKAARRNLAHRRQYCQAAVSLFDLFSQGSASSWIHMMDLMAYRTGHRLINVAVLGGVFGEEALNAVSSFGATVHEERHAID